MWDRLVTSTKDTVSYIGNGSVSLELAFDPAAMAISGKSGADEGNLWSCRVIRFAESGSRDLCKSAPFALTNHFQFASKIGTWFYV